MGQISLVKNIQTSLFSLKIWNYIDFDILVVGLTPSNSKIQLSFYWGSKYFSTKLQKINLFIQTCDVWDLPSSKWNGFGQSFMVLIRNCSVHSWHLNFSPQIASVQTLKCPSAIASRAFESLHWCNFGEKFKCHSCDGTISTKIHFIWKKANLKHHRFEKKTSQFGRREISNITGFEKINLFYATWLKNICPLL